MTRKQVDQRTLVNTLVEELSTEPGTDMATPDAAGPASDTDPAAVLESAIEDVPVKEGITFDPDLVKDNLDEILVSLIALRGTDETHGKALIDDLESLFETSLSPGTVYPRLHDLNEQELLDVYELVRTKEYVVDDEGGADRLLADAAAQHLALGLFLHASLEEL